MYLRWTIFHEYVYTTPRVSSHVHALFSTSNLYPPDCTGFKWDNKLILQNGIVESSSNFHKVLIVAFSSVIVKASYCV